jgi:hypothetical protein
MNKLGAPGKAAVSIVVSLGSSAACAFSVYSTDFENWPDPVSGSYQIYGGTFDGWTIGGTVDLIKGAHGAIDNKSIDLAGTPGPGFIERSYNQIAGYTYTLLWDYFRNADNGQGDGHTVTFGGVTTPYSVTTSVVAGATLSYVAGATSLATVRFSSTGTSGFGFENSFGATIDNISITAVPEPQAYALALAALGVLGAVSRRRWHRQAAPLQDSH